MIEKVEYQTRKERRNLKHKPPIESVPDVRLFT